MQRLTLLMAAAALVGGSFACSLFSSESEVSGDVSSDAGSDAGPAPGPTDAGVDTQTVIDSAPPAPQCEGTGGPTSVPVGAFCIDSTEVTNQQYLSYLIARKGATSGQVPECGWNDAVDALRPQQPWPFPQGQENYPVANVDWCDALAYCTFYGKRLCGRFGGGTVPIDQRASATISEWYAACSHDSDSLHEYSSGNTVVEGGCNFPVDGGAFAVAVGTRDCQGGFPGVYDLSGNVAEWEDACGHPDGSTGRDDVCLRRGGAYSYIDNCAGASGLDYPTRASALGDTGIRCCSDLK